MALLLEQQFAPLSDTNEIDTKTFLESVSYLPPFFDPVKYETLQQILLIEKSTYGSEWPKVGATLALMWLKRGLRFIQILLQSLADGERDENNPNLIRINITKAYDQALKRYHGWIVQKVFKSRITVNPECELNILDNILASFSSRGVIKQEKTKDSCLKGKQIAMNLS
ncbi:glycolipid transfer -like protein [Labeo rohita]|uniref:Glycolipid transfer-like protein n=1 Tax=Labeo rohita TaxID=84645 RepID=A0A498MHB6_LABRO|nr:glycolipid transfer -like protein [Labeo rohita]RXN32596.1 glycolipid transfer -like protein [Labeo rohita]